MENEQDLDPNELGEGEAWDADEAEAAAEDEGCEMHVLYAVLGGEAHLQPQFYIDRLVPLISTMKKPNQ